MKQSSLSSSRLALTWKAAVTLVIALTIGCLIMWRGQVKNGAGPTWREITVGRSTSSEVLAALGTPTSTEEEPGRIIYSYHEGPFEWGQHRIVICNGIVEQIEEDSLAYPYDTRLRQLVDQYGIPDYVVWSRESPAFRTAVFLERGVLVTATASRLDEAQVVRIHYYRPRSLARLLVDFRDVISFTNPFPDTDVIGPQDPWFKTP